MSGRSVQSGLHVLLGYIADEFDVADATGKHKTQPAVSHFLVALHGLDELPTIKIRQLGRQTEGGQLFGSGPSSVAETNTSTTVSLPVPVTRAPNQSPSCTELESVQLPGRFTNEASTTYSHLTSEPVTCTS